MQLLRTEKAVDVSWPDTPEPTAEQCDDGVRFAYLVPVSVDNDAKATAKQRGRCRITTSGGVEVGAAVMTRRVGKPMTAAALAGTIVLALAGCGMAGSLGTSDTSTAARRRCWEQRK
ncbi:hypothetical protein [Curtobacterium poinsettiae]|uniref:hypothetical protein n=1 Tax=Curtobacterium TaxID=2034 RepID=UPI00217D989B|nr:hypothetical protein [Curtobacterium flaccumfaciens]MCS6560284.1 hypothetical protein [Curtobacterium flaccumfaciens pv. poinsettiae]UXN27294.1 hypothetical protein N8D75_09180 [Curtobacterium flaccumfaciens]